MTYKTILTSKGTTTIPVEIRKQLGLKPGMYISFTKNKITGEYTLKRSQTIQEVRAMNKQALMQAGTTHKDYKSGDGFGVFVAQKHGDKE
jgi:bifunctional DNA-binding transcriptional regulator/antitoxin component of YhaV-PrlF toxin-antitoxin module